MKGWKKKRYMRKSALCSVLILAINPIAVAAAEQQYEGTTQMSTVDFCIEDFDSELVVEEVSVEAGTSVTAGTELLKLTSESYQNALTYYEAAILRAANTLTDTQREYEQGILDAKCEYENAETQAEQAEFVREYQKKELEDAIAEHEEFQVELEDKISDVEAGIASGSYGSNSGGSNSGGSNSGGSSSGGNDSSGNGSGFGKEETDGNQEMAEDKTEVIDKNDEMVSDKIPETPETPDTPDEPENPEEEQEEQITNLQQQITVCTQNYDEILTQIKILLEEEKGDGEDDKNQPDSDKESQKEELKKKLESSIDGDAIVAGHMKNVQQMVKNVPETVLSAAELAGIEYEKYITLLNDCISQMESDVAKQREILTSLIELNDTENEKQSNSNIDDEEISTLLTRLSEVSGQRMELYGQLITLEETWIASCQVQITEQQAQIEVLKKKLESAQNSDEIEGAEKPGETEEPDEAEKTDDSDRISGDKSSDGLEMESDENKTNGSTDMSSGSIPSGAGGTNLSGASAGSGFISETIATDSVSMDDLNLTQVEISLLGDTYDLSQVEKLLEQEPSDSDNAEQLLEQLEEAADTVAKQYAELLRKRKALELQVQYTYDTAILNGKLAEITYEQELQEWEDKLTEAENNKSELEKKKEVLDQMTDGIMTAEKDGIIAAVNYEAEDVLTSETPIVSYYNTDTITVTIAVPQEEIEQIHVGDEQEVVLSGRLQQTGIVTEKSFEIQEGTSRTTVNYEVTVSIENENGRLSSGMAAVITAGAGDNSSGEEENE